MNPQETQQVARDEKWVPSAERVKISSTNIRLETNVPQKEETFQVVINIIKNSTCFKAFTISANVPEIFMQQFWYTIKKVQDTNSYEFLLANKKCTINVEVFRTLLDICLRVEGVDFMDVPDDDTTLTFLIDLGYKGQLNRHTNMFVDHMHQPWRTLADIINKYLSGKTASNDKLRKSKIDILWGMFNRENVNYPELIWEDFAYQIDHRKEKRSRQSYQMFIKYSTNQIPPKKSRGKGLKGKKTAEESQETVDVSKESELEPKLAKKKTYSKRRVKKKVTMSADDNIISDDPDAALELAKQPCTGGSNEGTGSKSRVPDESIVVSATSSEGTGAKPRVPNEEKDITKEKDDKDDVETGSDEDEIYKYKRKDEDVEMKDAKVEESDKGEEKVTDAAKEEAEKNLEAKDDTKKTKLPLSSSSLSVSFGFGDQFLKLSSDSSLASTVKDSIDTNVSSLLDIPIQQETPQTQSPSVQKVPVSVILETTNLPPIPEIVTETIVSIAVPLPQVTPIISTVYQTPTPILTPPITTDAPTIITAAHESDALSTVELRVAKLEKDVSELRTVDHSSQALAVLQSQVLMVVDSYLDTKVRDVFQKELQKHMTDLIHIYSLHHFLELTKKPTPTDEQEYEKSPLDILKIKKEQAGKQTKPLFTIKSTNKAALE
ncbi:hypothetical protein Tco_0519984 [Tanacetum coccineum]